MDNPKGHCRPIAKPSPFGDKHNTDREREWSSKAHQDAAGREEAAGMWMRQEAAILGKVPQVWGR